MLFTARRNIQYPNPDRSDRPDIPAHLGYLAASLDVDVIYTSGTDAARLAAVHQANGGRFWWATDTGLMWYDDGAAWHQVGLPPSVGTFAARPAANAVSPGTIYFATDTGGVYESNGATWTLVSPGTQLDYAQIVANATIAGSLTEGTAATIVSGNNVTYDGTKVKITFNCARFQAGAGGSNGTYFICTRDGTVLGSIQGNNGFSTAEWFDTPAAGAHIYAIKAWSDTTNSGTVYAGAGGPGGVLMPAYIRVTKA